MPDTNVCQYFPRWFREILDFQYLCRSEKEELEALATAMARIHRNLFVQTMDESAAAQWEAILRILPAPGETLAFRRLRGLNRLAPRPHFTLSFLRQKLDVLCGEDGYRLDLRPNDYFLRVKLELSSEGSINEVRDLLERVVPAHLTAIVEVIYNTHAYLAGFTHADLAQYTHYQLRREKLAHRPPPVVDETSGIIGAGRTGAAIIGKRGS